MKPARFIILAALVVACGSSPAATTIVIYATQPPSTSVPTPLESDSLSTPAIVETQPPSTPQPPTLVPAEPTATPLVKTGMEPNRIYFGDSVDEDTLTIPEPDETFTRNQMVHWAFYLPYSVGVRTVSEVITEGDEGGPQQIVSSHDLEVDPVWREFFNGARLGRGVGKGSFVMRYYVGDTVIAEGRFSIE